MAVTSYQQQQYSDVNSDVVMSIQLEIGILHTGNVDVVRFNTYDIGLNSSSGATCYSTILHTLE